MRLGGLGFLLDDMVLTLDVPNLPTTMTGWLKAVPAEGENYLRLKSTVRYIGDIIICHQAPTLLPLPFPFSLLIPSLSSLTPAPPFLKMIGPKAETGHGVRGGTLPEHWRVLGRGEGWDGHGDYHDYGRHVHARLQLLRRQDQPNTSGTGYVVDEGGATERS